MFYKILLAVFVLIVSVAFISCIHLISVKSLLFIIGSVLLGVVVSIGWDMFKK